MHNETEGKLTLRLIPTSKGPNTRLIYREDNWPDLTLKWCSNRGETALHQDKKKTTSEIDSLPKMWIWFVWSFIVFSWLLRPLHINQKLFYHSPDPRLVLEINPIVGFVANYLCQALGYLGEFLYSKSLSGWPWENLLKKKNYGHIHVTIDITKWNPLTRPINNASSDPGHKFEFSSISLNQSSKQSFSKGKKSPIIMGWIYIDNTRLW